MAGKPNAGVLRSFQRPASEVRSRTAQPFGRKRDLGAQATQALSGGAWATLPKIGLPIRHPPGSVLFRQDASVDLLYLVTRGAVKLVRSDAGGCEAIAALRLPGWLLGLASALLDAPHAATAVTVGWTDVAAIGLQQFHETRSHEPAVAEATELALAHEVCQHVAQLGQFALDGRTRLRRLLADLAASCGRPAKDGAIRIEVRLTQVELADLMATSREHLNRLLGALTRDGVVRWRDGWLTIPKGSHDCTRDERRGPQAVGVTKVTQSV